MTVLKYLLFAFVAGALVTASDPFFGIELTLRPLPPEEPLDVKEMPWMSTDSFRKYLEDYDDRVSDTFAVKKFFYPSVNFWFLVYTQFPSDTVIIHDRNNLSLIYKVLDFSYLHKKGLPKNTVYILQNKISAERLAELKTDLAMLSRDPFSLSPEAKKIYEILKRSGSSVPVSREQRIKFFRSLRDGIRTQTGQKNFIRDGIVRSLPYQKFLKKYLKDRNLPKEILAIPFLESSFNPRAHSKANALGIWQFMPLIASYYMPKRTLITDYRYNVGISSIGAAFLMSENIFLMKSWDLAVTAYNSGTKHLIKTKRELGTGKVSLEDVIRHSKSEMFGFASKNFYAEFLALVHTLAYEEELFQKLHESDRRDAEDDLKFFLTKCRLKLSKELSSLELENIEFYNHQLHNLNHTLPRGFILTAKTDLPSRLFFELKYSDILKVKPKDWPALLRNQSCSMR